MLRFLAWVLLALGGLAQIDGSIASADEEARNPAGVSLGGALWAEIGGSDCTESGDVTSCTSGLNNVFYGGLAAFDLDLLHWLRVGLTAGLGYSGVDGSTSDSGERKTARHWFFPLTAHTYWRVELGKHITLWGGPEAGLGQYVINRTTVYADASSHSVSDKRSAFVAGVAVGLDARFWRALRVGVELGESVLLKPARANAEGDTLDLRAMTRFALVLRYL